MITKLQPLKNKLFLFFFLMLSIGVFGQTTLVNYQFNNNLNPDAGAIGSPNLSYHENGGAIKTPAYDSNMLRTSDGGDYLELTINTTGRSGIVLSFNGDFQALGLTGYWRVAVDSGSGYVDRGQLSLFSIFFLRTSGNLSVNISDLDPAANNNPNLKIKITADSSAWFDLWNLRIDNVKITSGSPKIRVYNYEVISGTGYNTYIPHLSPASVALKTDFGTRQTSDPALQKTFRIRNYLGETGSKLQVSGITVMGANPGDFTITLTPHSGVTSTTNESSTDAGTYQTFTINFLPLADGIRTAEIYVYSNAAPSPYIFTVIGTGASCNLIPTDYAVNTMATGQQTLTSNYTSTDLIGGVAYTTGSNYNTLNTRLYPTGNLYTSASTSWYVRNTTKTVEFGGTAGLDISKQKNVTINFSVAAFGTGSSTGVTTNDYITLSVLKPDNTWSDELRLVGGDVGGWPFYTVYAYNYGFSGGSTVSGTYDGNGTAITSTNTGSTKYKQFNLNIPASANISNLKFKIEAHSDGSNRLWLIDDVKVLSDNAVSKTYTTSWSPSAPNPNEKAVIQGNYTIPYDASNPTNSGLKVCECEVASTGSITIPDTRYLQVQGKITNLGNGNNFIVKSGGNLIQIEDAAENTGSIKVERNVVYSPNRAEYNFFSSPVENQNMKELFGAASNTPFVLVLDEPYNNFTNAKPTDYLIKGKGFAVKEPKAAFTTPTATFFGVPDNGIISIGVTRSPLPGEGWNLVGNPYPSNIDATKVYAASTNIESTFKFWDNTVNATYTYNGTYGQYSYALLNASTGVGSQAPALDPTNGTPTTVSGKKPNKNISVGQGFIVEAKAGGGTVVFRNKLPNGDMMRTSSAPGATFFGKQASSDSLNLFRLQYKTPDGIVLTQTIAYLENGNNGYGVEDSPHPGLESLDLFYGFADDEKVLINGRAPFNTEDVLPLGYKAYKQGVYFISLSDHEGIFDNSQHIYLKDKYSGIITDLSESYYSFNTEEGEFTNRFEIVYKPEATLDVTGINKDAIQIYRDGDDFVVRSSAKSIKEVELYDMSGKLFYKTNANAKEVRIPAYRMVVNGIYILKAQLENGEIVNKKIRK